MFTWTYGYREGMLRPPEPDPLEAKPVRPQRAHRHLLALAAVSSMSLPLAQRLTLYGIKSCDKMLEDLKHWAGEMVPWPRAEVADK